MTEHAGSATSTGSVAPVSHAAGASEVPGHGPGPFVSQVPGTAVSFPPFHGRRVSWISVTVIMVAFLIGGLALVFGPVWWLFWAGLGLAFIGLLMCAAIGIFDDWY